MNNTHCEHKTLILKKFEPPVVAELWIATIIHPSHSKERKKKKIIPIKCYWVSILMYRTDPKCHFRTNTGETIDHECSILAPNKLKYREIPELEDMPTL